MINLGIIFPGFLKGIPIAGKRAKIDIIGGEIITAHLVNCVFSSLVSLVVDVI